MCKMSHFLYFVKLYYLHTQNDMSFYHVSHINDCTFSSITVLWIYTATPDTKEYLSNMRLLHIFQRYAYLSPKICKVHRFNGAWLDARNPGGAWGRVLGRLRAGISGIVDRRTILASSSADIRNLRFRHSTDLTRALTLLQGYCFVIYYSVTAYANLFFFFNLSHKRYVKVHTRVYI